MYINLKNLKIARKNAGYSTLEATRAACGRIQLNKVEQWEAGTHCPTWPQLKKLANAYQINVFLLASKEKVTRDRTIKDYRKQGIETESELNTKKFIHFLLQRQKYLANTMKDDGMKKNPLVGIVQGYKNKDPGKVAQLITKEISYQYETSMRSHLKYLISLLEEESIFVMKTLSYWNIPVENMRGVYLKNEYAPIIALNRKDAKTAQLFTLAHEVAHLFTNSEGISNIDFRGQSRDPLEIFCNKVAANLLLPEDRIEKRRCNIDDIEEIAKQFQVSELFTFYRLKNLGLLEGENISLMEQNIKEKSEQLMASKSDSSGGGNFTNNMKDSNGYLFNNFIASLYFENKINAAEASKILKLSIDKV